MDKLTLYKKGGVLYYKKGGKMCKYEGGGPTRFRLPKYQNSGYTTDEIAPINIGKDSGYQIANPYMDKVIDRNVPSVDNPNKGSKFNQGQYANWINSGSQLLNLIPQNQGPDYANNKYMGMAFQGAKAGRAATDAGYATGQGVLNSVNPLIGSIVGAGRGVSDMIAGENKTTGEADPVRRAIANQLSPSSRHEQGFKTGAEFGAGWGILEGITGIPIGDIMRAEKRKKAEKELKWDQDRQGMFNSETTGQYRNDSIYAKHGAYIKKSANHNPNAEIETGEVVMTPDGMDTNSVTMNPNVNTSMVSDKAFLVKGKTHEQGGETGNFPEGTYIFSDHLGMNGMKAKKGEKTVAQLAKPHAKALSQMEKRPTDKYLNNPKAKQYHETQLNQLAEMAEAGKQQANQNQMFKSAIKTAKGIYQSGGILQDYATQKMKIDPSFVKKAVTDDPMNYKFNNPDLYKGKEFDSYQDEEVIPAEEVDLNINVEEGVDLGTEARQGDRPDITTLDAQAGKSKYSGTSNLIQEKVREMIDDNFFDENGRIAPEWKQKLKSEYDLSDDEVNNATMETITEGRVGKSVGKLLQDAYGVLGKGKDEQSRLVESNTNRKTDRPVINNKLSWADDIVGQIKDNGNILPSQYQSLPDDLKDTLIQLARTGKRASEGSFTPSLDRAYRAANESVASEVDRQKSMTYDTQSAEGAKLDSNYDLVYNRKDGSIQSFGVAFREAKDGGLDEFTYKGKKYSTATRSEDPTLAKASDAIKATQSTKPINQLNITPTDQMKKVINPTRKLSTLLNGGYTYQNGGTKIEGFTPNYNMLPNKANPQAIIGKINRDNLVKAARITSPAYAQDRANFDAYKATMMPQITQRMVDPNNPYSKINQGKANAMYQMGGEMQEQMPNESNDHMNQLMSGDPQAVQEEQMEQAPTQMAQGQMPVQITQLEPALQQMFMQLSPEQQQQILSLPPDQIEIALMTLAQQMGMGQPTQQAQPQMGGMSEVPAGVMEQMG